MKSNELLTTDENIMSSFLQDTIGRSRHVLRFVILLNSIEGGFSIALDGKWGSGKTFFVKQTILALNAYNDSIKNMSSDDKENIVQFLLSNSDDKQIELRPFVSVYYNAWANDNDIDPVLSIVYKIIQSVETDYSFKKIDCRKLAASIAEVLTGRNTSALHEALKGENPLAPLMDSKYLQESILEFFEQLLEERGDRLVLFIDELDRCKPRYAVQLLERIKHYFSNDRITFVFSINIDELQHTVKRHYGDGFDGNRYLDRFFDLRMSLPQADMQLFYRHQGLEDSKYLFGTVCIAVIEVYHFTFREATRFLKQAKAAVYKPICEDRGPLFSDGRAIQLCLICIVPLMIGLKICNQTRYDSFITGNDSSPLHEVYKGKNEEFSILNWLLSQGEKYGRIKIDDEPFVSTKDKLEQVYDALFRHDYSSGSREIVIGEVSFDRETKKTLIETVNLWSSFADFEL